jgi:hypothetical protein
MESRERVKNRILDNAEREIKAAYKEPLRAHIAIVELCSFVDALFADNTDKDGWMSFLPDDLRSVQAAVEAIEQLNFYLAADKGEARQLRWAADLVEDARDFD